MLLLGAIAFLSVVSALKPQPASAAQRGTVCYTAWDDYFFYAAFQVDDPRVNSVNNTPLSQPQQDDDIEVFFDTKGPKASASRLPDTYQMAVSAGSGAYFSAGSAAGTPQPKLVFTYKYAATVDGTLKLQQRHRFGLHSRDRDPMARAWPQRPARIREPFGASTSSTATGKRPALRPTISPASRPRLIPPPQSKTRRIGRRSRLSIR